MSSQDLRRRLPGASYGRLAPVRPVSRAVGTRPVTGRPLARPGAVGLSGRRSRTSLLGSLLRGLLSRRSPLRHLDWVLLLAVLALALIGTLLVWSATQPALLQQGADPRTYLMKQLLNIGIGLIFMFTVTVCDHRLLRMCAPVLYVVSCLGLLVVLTPLGSIVNGAHSWISLPGGFQIEPSEFAKLAIILMIGIIAGELRQGETRPRVRALLLATGCAAVPIALVALEPDLGVVVLMLVILVGMIALSGIRLRWLAACGLSAAALVYGAINLHLLKAYQVDRFGSFLHPSADPRGTGYSAHQAKIAIGSGGLTGQGLFHGQLIAGNFIPEQHTDFIFAVAGEELGFAGAVAIIALLALLLLRALRIAARADDQFGMLVASGIAIWFAVQAFINIGMTVGIMPVTGLPLPFVSYGGSAMFADMIAIGALQSVYRHRTVFT